MINGDCAEWYVDLNLVRHLSEARIPIVPLSILLKLCWFLMAQAKLSILLFMFSKILSLEATFLDNLSITLD